MAPNNCETWKPKPLNSRQSLLFLYQIASDYGSRDQLVSDYSILSNSDKIFVGLNQGALLLLAWAS